MSLSEWVGTENFLYCSDLLAVAKGEAFEQRYLHFNQLNEFTPFGTPELSDQFLYLAVSRVQQIWKSGYGRIT